MQQSILQILQELNFSIITRSLPKLYENRQEIQQLQDLNIINNNNINNDDNNNNKKLNMLSALEMRPKPQYIWTEMIQRSLFRPVAYFGVLQAVLCLHDKALAGCRGGLC